MATAPRSISSMLFSTCTMPVVPLGRPTSKSQAPHIQKASLSRPQWPLSQFPFQPSAVHPCVPCSLPSIRVMPTTITESSCIHCSLFPSPESPSIYPSVCLFAGIRSSTPKCPTPKFEVPHAQNTFRSQPQWPRNQCPCSVSIPTGPPAPHSLPASFRVCTPKVFPFLSPHDPPHS